MKIKLKDLIKDFDWDKVCEIKGLNPYCIAEGANPEDYEDFTIEEYLKLIGREKDIKYFKIGEVNA
jgi:hypothetical protein